VSEERQIQLALLALILFFGGSFTCYTEAQRAFGIVTVNAMRFTIAGTALCLLARNRLAGARPVRRQLLVAGAFGVGMMACLMAFGVDRSSPTLAALIFAMESIGVAVMASTIAGDHPSRQAWFGLAIGFVGATIASGVFTEPIGDVPLVALVAMLAAVVCFSAYAGVLRRISPDTDSLAVAAISQIGALLFVIPAILLDTLDRGIVRGPVTTSAVLGVLFLGFGSAAAYLLLATALGRAPASRVAMALYLLPISGVLIAWIVLGEPPQVREVVGGAIILGAVWVAERKPRRVAAATARQPRDGPIA
jgi:drug/metabolite transporter (DMT)-like permease